jgi:hypothetical protein
LHQLTAVQPTPSSHACAGPSSLHVDEAIPPDLDEEWQQYMLHFSELFRDELYRSSTAGARWSSHQACGAQVWSIDAGTMRPMVV